MKKTIVLLALILIFQIIRCENKNINYVWAPYFNSSEMIYNKNDHYLLLNRNLLGSWSAIYYNVNDLSYKIRDFSAKFVYPADNDNEFYLVDVIDNEATKIALIDVNNKIKSNLNIKGSASVVKSSGKNLLINTDNSGGIYFITINNEHLISTKLNSANARSRFSINGDYILEYFGENTKLYYKGKIEVEINHFFNMVALSKNGDFLGVCVNNEGKLEYYYLGMNRKLENVKTIDAEGGAICQLSDSGEIFAYGNKKKITVRNTKTGDEKDINAGDFTFNSIDFDSMNNFYIIKSSKIDEVNTRLYIQNNMGKLITIDNYDGGSRKINFYFNATSFDIILCNGIICRINKKELINE